MTVGEDSSLKALRAKGGVTTSRTGGPEFDFHGGTIAAFTN